LSDRFHIERTERAAARVRDESRVRIEFANLRVPQPPEFKEPLLVPEDVVAPRRILRVAGARQVQAVSRLEVAPAVFAITHPRTRPPVAEDAINLIARHDLPVDFSHELEVIR